MYTVLCSDAEIPVLGLGTFALNGEAGYRMFSAAIEMGYRHFDTAERYGNEAEVGAALAASGLPRDVFFVTTKVWPTHYRRKEFAQSVAMSIDRLGLAPDLLLLHFPPSDCALAEAVEALVGEAEKGNARHIGVSNFTLELVEQAARLSPRPLVANQVEYHPFLDQSLALQDCQARGMALIAYSPLAQGCVFRSDLLDRIGRAHGKTAGQVTLRWLIQQRAVVAIPRSTSKRHARLNLDVFDFELQPEEMEAIAALAERRVGPGAPIIHAPPWIGDE